MFFNNGSNMGSWKRKNQQAANRLVEIYFSPPRLPNRKFSPGGTARAPRNLISGRLAGGAQSKPALGRGLAGYRSSVVRVLPNNPEADSNNTRTRLEQHPNKFFPNLRKKQALRPG
jgi:hypothetical protein